MLIEELLAANRELFTLLEKYGIQMSYCYRKRSGQMDKMDKKHCSSNKRG